MLFIKHNTQGNKYEVYRTASVPGSALNLRVPQTSEEMLSIDSFSALPRSNQVKKNKKTFALKHT